MIQADNVTVGACYPECIPGGAACAGGATCKSTFDATSGFCWASGSAQEGQSCTSKPVNTGCATGLICATDQGASICRKTCSFWSSFPGCPSGQNCAINSICFAEAGDPAALGAPCSVTAAGGEPCGSDGQAWRGICQDLGSGQECAKPCRYNVTADCTSGTTCSAANPGEIGVCY